MKKVVFIAGGIWQKSFVEYLKSQQLFVAVVNPVVTETTQLADLHIVADINDLETINAHIEKLKPDFITSDQSDVSTMIVAELSNKWGLPSNHPDVIDKFTNKFSMYEYGKSINILVPETAMAVSFDDVQKFADQHGYPIIVKPLDSTMSRGFRKINNQEENTETLFLESLKFSKSKQLVVQEFIAGDMVTLEGVCSGSKHKTIAHSKKDYYFKPGINSGVRYPSCIPFMDKIIEINDRYVELSGMQFGLTHSEYIITENKQVYLIEIGARGGGAGITNKIVPWVSGINVYDILYRSLNGEIVNVKQLNPLQKSALLKYYESTQIIDFNQDKEIAIGVIGGVAEFCYNFIGKQYVSDKNDSRHTMGIFLGESADEVNLIEQKVQQILLNPNQ